MMKKLQMLFAAFTLLMFTALWAQNDDFGDGNFTANPAWSGDTGSFAIQTAATLPGGSATTDGFYLGANSNTSNATLVTASNEASEWKFSLGSASFSPSSTNYFGVVLMSNNSITGSITGTSWNGYYLKVGVDGSTDYIELWKKSGTGTGTKVGEFTAAGNFGGSGLANGINLRITRSSTGVWTLYYATGFTYSSTPATAAATLTDNTYSSSNYFGVFQMIANPATSRRVYIDNITLGAVAVTPSITSSLTASSTYGAAATYQIAASNTPTSYDATDLPAGATVNTSSGLISFSTTVAAGTYSITISATNTAGTDSKTLVYTRNKASQTIGNFTSNISKVYNSAPFNPGATATSGLAVSYSSSNTAVATVSGSIITIVGVGTSTITATQAGNANYNAATQVQRTLTVSKAPQTISFGTLPVKTYGDEPFMPDATASSGIAVTYTSSNTSVATVDGATVTIVAPGSTVITASQAGNANYSAATAVPQTLTVNPKALTVAGAVAASKIYDGTTATTVTGAGLSAGIVGSDEVYLDTYTAAFSDANAGTGKSVTLSYTLAGAQASRYTLVQQTGITADITAKDVTITGLAVNSKSYDGTTAATLSGTAALSGVEAADQANVTLTGTPVATFGSAEIGTHAVSVTGYSVSGSAAGNYNLVQPQGLMGTITNPALNDQTITFSQPDAIAYGATATLTATATSGGQVTFTSSDETIATISGNTVTAVGIGTVTLTATQSGGNGYNPAPPVMQELVVNPKQLTVLNASATAKEYDGTTAATLTGILSGVINDDAVTLSGSGMFQTATAGTAKPVTTMFEISGADAYKYTLAQPSDVTGNVTPASITVSNAAAQDKVYDSTTAAVITGTLSGVIGSDSVTLLGIGTFATATAGTDVPVISNATLGGTDAGNYTLVQPTGLTADITTAPLTISGLTGADKVYDGTTAGTVTGTPLPSGIIGSDDVTVSGTPVVTFASDNAGNGIAIMVSGYNRSGADAANYSLVQPQGLTASIIKKSITADTGAASAVKTYDGTTAASISGAALNGVVSGDSVTLSGTYASANAGSAIAIALALTGSDSANYTLDPATGFTGTITKKALTATADTKTINKGDVLPAFTISFTGFVAGEDASDLATTPSASVSISNTNTAGAYPITLTGGSAANYDLNLVNGWLIINDLADGTIVSTTTIWSNDINASNPSTDNPFTAGQTLLSDYVGVIGIGRGTGLTGNSGANRYNTKDFNTGNIDLNQYFTFTITPLTGYKVDIASFVYTGQLSSGNLQMELRTSKDNFATAIGNPTAGGTTIDLSSLGNLAAATEFRLYIWGGTVASTTYSINSFYFTGAIIGLTGTPGTAPVITSSTTDSASVGTTDTYQITTSGSPVITGYTATGTDAAGVTTTALPQGATFDNLTGLISFDGSTPIGTYYIKISATNYYGTGSAVITYNVLAAPLLTVAPDPVTLHAYQGQAASNTQVQFASVTGSNLTSATNGPITITASAGFVISINASAFGSSNTIYYSGTSLSLTNPQIFVKLDNNLAVGNYTGTLTFTGGGATTSVVLNGTVETAPAIRTTEALYGPYCSGTTGTIQVAYTTEGTFPSGSFFVQYSNASGGFSGLSNTIYASGGNASPLTATLPSNLAPGNYLVRVIHLTDGESPVLTTSSDEAVSGMGADNGSFIYVNAVPTLSGISTSAICAGQDAVVALSGLLADASSQYTHTINYTINGQVQPAATTTAGGTTFSVPSGFSNNDMLTITSITRVRADDAAQSCTATINVSTQLQVAPSLTVTSVAAAPVCEGSTTTIALNGLLANATFSANYTVDGEPAIASVTSDASGIGSISTTLSAGSHAITLLSLTRTDTTPSCSSTFTGIETTAIVNERPAAQVVAGNGTICLGASANINISISGTAPWELTYTNGSATDTITVTQAEVTAGVYTLVVVPTEGTSYYSVIALSDSNCTAQAADLTGTAAITANANTFTAAADTNWFNAANWSCGAVPDETISATISAGTATISGNTVANTQQLSIMPGASVVVASGATLNVVNKITNNGAMTVENNANLLQENSIANTGSIIVKRNSSPLYRQDYTMWSSPVAGQNLLAFSPVTLTNRFYTYNSANDQFAATNTAGTFDTAKGYLIRMPNGALDSSGNPSGSTADAYQYQQGTTTMVYNGQFEGVPNNGDISIPLSAAGNGFNLVGNPYPSPVSIAALRAANQDVIDGTIWVWRKKNASTNSAYCTVNSVGIYTGNGEPEQEDPGNIIRTGQGFIVKLKPGYTSTNLVFNNGMRSADTANQFFRMSNAGNNVMPESHGIWLNLTNANGFFSQMYAGYIAGATEGVDFGIDSRYINDNATVLANDLDNTDYIIQGRSLPFSAEDVVPLRFRSATAGNFTIALDHVNGLFAQGQQVFLKDKQDNTLHNLSNSGYTFATQAGEFADRFEIVYTDAALGTGPVAQADTVVVYRDANGITVTAGKETIQDINVYDVRGRLLYSNNNINATETTLSSLVAERQVLIVKVTLTNGATASKKVAY